MVLVGFLFLDRKCFFIVKICGIENWLCNWVRKVWIYRLIKRLLNFLIVKGNGGGLNCVKIIKENIFNLLILVDLFCSEIFYMFLLCFKVSKGDN